MATFKEVEYAQFLAASGKTSGTIKDLQLDFFTQQIGRKPASVMDGYTAYLQKMTGLKGTFHDLFKQYAVTSGVSSSLTIHDMMFDFYQKGLLIPTPGVNYFYDWATAQNIQGWTAIDSGGASFNQYGMYDTDSNGYYVSPDTATGDVQFVGTFHLCATFSIGFSRTGAWADLTVYQFAGGTVTCRDVNYGNNLWSDSLTPTTNDVWKVTIVSDVFSLYRNDNLVKAQALNSAFASGKALIWLATNAEITNGTLSEI